MVTFRVILPKVQQSYSQYSQAPPAGISPELVLTLILHLPCPFMNMYCTVSVTVPGYCTVSRYSNCNPVTYLLAHRKQPGEISSGVGIG